LQRSRRGGAHSRGGPVLWEACSRRKEGKEETWYFCRVCRAAALLASPFPIPGRLCQGCCERWLPEGGTNSISTLPRIQVHGRNPRMTRTIRPPSVRLLPTPCPLWRAASAAWRALPKALKMHWRSEGESRSERLVAATSTVDNLADVLPAATSHRSFCVQGPLLPSGTPGYMSCAKE
jgi:hypothetical protein